jgi:hypothetical protein
MSYFPAPLIFPLVVRNKVAHLVSNIPVNKINITATGGTVSIHICNKSYLHHKHTLST